MIAYCRERNIHDGAQQHLAALAVKLSLASKLAERDIHRTKRLLELSRQVQDSAQSYAASLTASTPSSSCTFGTVSENAALVAQEGQ